MQSNCTIIWSSPSLAGISNCVRFFAGDSYPIKVVSQTDFLVVVTMGEFNYSGDTTRLKWFRIKPKLIFKETEVFLLQFHEQNFNLYVKMGSSILFIIFYSPKVKLSLISSIKSFMLPDELLNVLRFRISGNTS